MEDTPAPVRYGAKCTGPPTARERSSRVLLICSSLEPGRDGVGDYCRRLAAECIRQGTSCAVLALNDRYLETAVDEYQSNAGTRVPCLRLPKSQAWPKRVERAREFKREFRPDALSLQFTAYGYHDRGLPIALPSHLRVIGESTPWHVNFHELWIGPRSPFALKQQVIRALQKLAVRRLVRQCKARRTTVTFPLNQERLQSIGASSTILPIFSNLPLCESPSVPEETAKILATREHWLICFGSAPEPTVTHRVLAAIADLSDADRRSLGVLLVGKQGTHGPLFRDGLIRLSDENSLAFLELGVLPEADISALMQVCDAGLTRSPMDWISKSGVAHAMAEHRLNLWGPFPTGPAVASELVEGKFSYFLDLMEAIRTPPRVGPVSGVEAVAARFIKMMAVGCT